ncbi:hypothetical protein GLGCALEP_01542 [Pseudomonas sp. MM221]|nr:hypothetical protein GLGCALEP_01542 [Pseudomonas sp. MM221]
MVELKGQPAMPLAEALQTHLEIAKVTTQQLQAFAVSAPDLQRLLQPEYKAELQEWLWGRQLVDVLRAFPQQLPLAGWLDLLKPLQPRLYSISSSPLAHPGQVHLTVSTVRYGERKGVCSAFLADRAQALKVAIFPQVSKHFRLPEDDSVPVIMVGPGTGIAPFRAFLEEREARGAKGVTGCSLASSTPLPTSITGSSYRLGRQAATCGWIRRFPATRPRRSMCSSACLSRARSCGNGWRRGRIFISAVMPSAWPRMWMRRCAKSLSSMAAWMRMPIWRP